MGASTPVLTLIGRSGAHYSRTLYFAGADVRGYRVPTSGYGVAIAGDNPEFHVPEPCKINNLSGPATGTLRVFKNGRPDPGGGVIDLVAVIQGLGTTSFGPVLLPGNTYELQVEETMAA